MEEKEFYPILYQNAKIEFLSKNTVGTVVPINESGVFVRKSPEIVLNEFIDGSTLKDALKYPGEINYTEDNKVTVKRDELVSFMLSTINNLLITRGINETIESNTYNRFNTSNASFYINLDPYELFNTHNYTLRRADILQITITRLSNKRTLEYKLDSNSKRFMPSEHAQDFCTTEWPETTTPAEMRQIIIDHVTKVAEAFVDAWGCSKLKPAQRGFSNTCKSCDYQLKCSVRT